MVFENRAEAGKALATRLAPYADRSDVLVLALPRGGVPVAFEVARALRVELDVLVVRKLGVPGHGELAMGAIASNGVIHLNDDIVRSLGIGEHDIERVAAREGRELARREQLYRAGRPAPDVKGRTLIVVDDGVATGATLMAALMLLRGLNPAKLVVGVPTGARAAVAAITAIADEVICLVIPQPYRSVGATYGRFPQVSDDEVRALLATAAEPGFGRT